MCGCFSAEGRSPSLRGFTWFAGFLAYWLGEAALPPASVRRFDSGGWPWASHAAVGPAGLPSAETISTFTSNSPLCDGGRRHLCCLGEFLRLLDFCELHRLLALPFSLLYFWMTWLFKPCTCTCVDVWLLLSYSVLVMCFIVLSFQNRYKTVSYIVYLLCLVIYVVDF